MKAFARHSAFWMLLSLLLAPLAVAHALAPPADSVPFCQPLDFGQWERDRSRQAAKLAQGDSPENLVRLIYVLPNDRVSQPDIDTKLDTQIKYAQSFFADVMEKHGFGRKTFRFEADTHGRAMVHHVNGKFATEHYNSNPWSVWEELIEQFDLSGNIYLVTLDTGSASFFEMGGSSDGGASGGAIVHAYDPAIAHELGHAFGLNHDYYRYEILDVDWMIESFCAAEWLDVNRYFNDTPISPDTPATIQLLPLLSAPPYGIRLRFEVIDADGSHQAQLFANVTADDDQYTGGFSLIDCKSFNGGSNTVEFVTNALTGHTTATTEVWLHVTDVRGNFTVQRFPIDVAPLLPRPEVVSIPDANLVAALRRGIRIAPGEAITQLDMVRLRRLNEAGWSQIADLTGLEYAIDLTWLNLSGNQIRDLTPLAGLTKLTRLDLRNNQISDISPLTGLTKLTRLDLTDNQISDISPLTGLVNLKRLFLGGNSITTIPNKAATVDLFLYGLDPPDKATIESRKFIIFNGVIHEPNTVTVGHINLNPTDPVTVKALNFDGLLHSDNLAGFFDHGGMIELLTVTDADFGDVVISEIMWGLNGGSTADQWIELYNTTPYAITLHRGTYGANWAFRFSYGNISELENIQDRYWKVVDRVSNANWKVPGQSGNTDQNQPLVSMYRTINYETGSVPDGTLASSWKASTGRVNLFPPSYGTPGAKHLLPQPTPQEDDGEIADDESAGEDQPSDSPDDPESDPQLASLAVTINDVTSPAERGQMTFTVRLDPTPTAPTTVKYTTTSQTATAGQDYEAATGTLHFEAKQNTATFTVRIRADQQAEPNETFGVRITHPSTGALLAEATGTITDDDAEASAQAWLTPDPAEVAFSADDPAWTTFTVHTTLDSVLVRANPPGSDPALEVAGGQQVPTRDFCPAEGNDRPTRARRDGWSLHVKACQAGQTKILLINYDTGEVVQQYEVNVEGSSVAATTALNPSYPNPFNSETVLSYTLPTAADIRLEVFTLSGQRVAILHAGFQAAGYHTIALDASDLASGVYLYRLTTPEGRFARKFTLLR